MSGITRREARLLAINDMVRKESAGVDPAPILGETAMRKARKPYRPETTEPRAVNWGDVLKARRAFELEHAKEGRQAAAIVVTPALYALMTAEQNVVALPTYCGLAVRVRDVDGAEWIIE